jgi:ubiquinone/menaquinone biosynthesis C-methylase UbiE
MLPRPETPPSKLTIDLELLRLRAGHRLLDLGCGDGRHTLAATRRGCRVVAFDTGFWELVKVIALLLDEQAARDLADRVRPVVGDAAHLPFPDATFDRVICAEILEHLPDDNAALHEACRVLRPGGLLALSVPSHFTERVYWALSPDYGNFPGGHLRIYEPEPLLRRLYALGLRPFALRYVHFLDSIIWLRNCLLDRMTIRPRRPAIPPSTTDAILSSPSPPPWRRALRRALPGSRFMRALDSSGALVLPKSLALYARKPGPQ